MGAGFNRTVRKLTAALDLPADVVLDLPRITVIGNSEMLLKSIRALKDIRLKRFSCG